MAQACRSRIRRACPQKGNRPCAGQTRDGARHHSSRHWPLQLSTTMSKLILHAGDKVIVQDNGVAEQAVVESILGSQVTLRTNNGGTLTRDAALLTHVRPPDTDRRVLPAPPISERRI